MSEMPGPQGWGRGLRRAPLSMFPRRWEPLKGGLHFVVSAPHAYAGMPVQALRLLLHLNPHLRHPVVFVTILLSQATQSITQCIRHHLPLDLQRPVDKATQQQHLNAVMPSHADLCKVEHRACIGAETTE